METFRHIHLITACQNGHLQIIQWLINHFGITKDTQNIIKCALRVSCQFGQLQVAQWLVVHFGLTKVDIQDDINPILQSTCAYGHFHVLE